VSFTARPRKTPASTKYTRPYALDAAAKGNYDAAELFENYMCPTCHVVSQVGHTPSDDEFSLRRYVTAYQENYKIGALIIGYLHLEGAWQLLHHESLCFIILRSRVYLNEA
jgi:hypothetical protein